eukprot:TRINITY_DN3955_c0_g1_i1.p1 TRINITY_DN3955_c0_g1~~TRINITY_DN3955_c0_g1_i1.p1  ORF type:complete len:317 (+),score=23.72 TRINITY_DN3955_c0_g1_i1:110-952(+)
MEELSHPFIDTHVHLDMISENELKQNKRKLDILDRKEMASYMAEKFGDQFAGCVNVCCDPRGIEENKKLMEDHDLVFGSFGVHPHGASKYSDEIEKRLEEVMSHPKCVAWGECGLDFFKNFSKKDEQLVAFERQMKKAVQLKKPLIVHTRDAEDDTWRLMEATLPKDHKIHVHCFTGTIPFIQMILNHFPNSFVGFTGAITFKSAESNRETVKNVPLDRILLETDGPFMAPVPYRGAVAQCGHIPFVAKQVAELHGVPVKTVLDQTRKNAQKMYGCFEKE